MMKRPALIAASCAALLPSACASRMALRHVGRLEYDPPPVTTTDGATSL
jgi:hypothetical protein